MNNIKCIAVDDNILIKDEICTAGSRMLYNYRSVFSAEAVERLSVEGVASFIHAGIGEFGLDVACETSAYDMPDAARLLNTKQADAALCVDINGAPRRLAALNGLTFLKPTYGTVSRYGVIPCVCSGEQIGVMAESLTALKDVLSAIDGGDIKDGTCYSGDYNYSLTDGVLGKKIAVVSELLDGASADTLKRIDEFKRVMSDKGAKIHEISCSQLALCGAAYHIALTAETCNNLSRYDGIRFGYRPSKFETYEDIYFGSRTDGFGLNIKNIILYGSFVLSKNEYKDYYEKALKTRRVVRDKLSELFSEYDMILSPACSQTSYDKSLLLNDFTAPIREEYYSSVANLTGIPSLVTGGIQLTADYFGESTLLSAANSFMEEA